MAINNLADDPAEQDVEYYIETYGDLAEVVVALNQFRDSLSASESSDTHDNNFLQVINDSVSSATTNAKKLLNRSAAIIVQADTKAKTALNEN